jgi:hypothetical protein
MSSSDFEWGIKNGDLEKVKEAVEKVCPCSIFSFMEDFYNTFLIC